MSRNLELVSEILDINLKTPVTDLETICAKTAELLLERHDYATFAEVKAEADYFKEVKYPDGKKGSEPRIQGSLRFDGIFADQETVDEPRALGCFNLDPGSFGRKDRHLIPFGKSGEGPAFHGGLGIDIGMDALDVARIRKRRLGRDQSKNDG